MVILEILMSWLYNTGNAVNGTELYTSNYYNGKFYDAKFLFLPKQKKMKRIYLEISEI